MDSLAQLEKYSNEIATAVESLETISRNIEGHQNFTLTPFGKSNPAAHEEIQRVKARILSNATRIRGLVWGPAEFLKHLASQNEILACIRWLGDFQILACIPLAGNALITDVADLSSVPKTHLGRIVRLTATVGFLSEPQPGHVAHTPLSSPFVSDPSLLDAAMFLAESAAPAALHMALTTPRLGGSDGLTETAWNLASNATQPFHNVRLERPKLSRQWSAYLHHAAGVHSNEEIVDLLSKLNWSKLGNACVVEVGAQSITMAQCLADLHPGLRLVVQINNTLPTVPLPDRLVPATRSGEPDTPVSSTQVTVMVRTTRQSIVDAAVYILHPPSSRSLVLEMLQEHMEVLRTNSGVMLLLTHRLLPEPGSLSDNPEVEAVARARDLSMLQLANEGEMEMTELFDLIATARDNLGKLLVTNRLRSREGLIIALVVKYQAYANASRVLDNPSSNPF